MKPYYIFQFIFKIIKLVFLRDLTGFTFFV